jgi:hypothetical protein
VCVSKHKSVWSGLYICTFPVNLNILVLSLSIAGPPRLTADLLEVDDHDRESRWINLLTSSVPFRSSGDNEKQNTTHALGLIGRMRKEPKDMILAINVE